MIFLVWALIGTSEIKTDVGDICEHPLVMGLVQHFDSQFDFQPQVCRTECPDNTNIICNATVQIEQLVTSIVSDDGMMTREDALFRRLTLDNDTNCDQYHCPPGPCTVLDVDYQSDWSVADDVAFSSHPRVRCGPSFGVQLQKLSPKKEREQLEPIDDVTMAAFPSVYAAGIDVYGQHGTNANAATHLFAVGGHGIVPVAINVTNTNPSWYYNNEAQKMANPYHANYGLYGLKCSGSRPPHNFKPTWFAQPDGVSYLGLGQNDSSKNMTPQTLVSQQDDFNVLTNPEAMCDVSQCDWVPVYNSKKTHPQFTVELINCFFADLLREFTNASGTTPFGGQLDMPGTCFDKWTAQCNYADYVARKNKPKSTWPAVCSAHPPFKAWWHILSPVPLHMEAVFGKPGYFARSTGNPSESIRYPTGHGINVPFHEFLTANANTNDKTAYDTSITPTILKKYGAGIVFPQSRLPPFRCVEKGFATPLKGVAYRNTAGTKGVSYWAECLNTAYGWNNIFDCLFNNANVGAQVKSNSVGKVSKDNSIENFARWVWAAAAAHRKLNGGDIKEDPLHADMMVADDSLPMVNKPFTAIGTAITTDVPVFPVSPVVQNASMSGACDCSDSTVRYAVARLEWDEFTDSNTYQNTIIDRGISGVPGTALVMMSYGWRQTDGDVRDGTPIGLYMPSPLRFGRDFKVHERNLLTPQGRTDMNQTAANRYLFDVIAEDALEEMIFNLSSKKGSYFRRTVTYKYGSCMRYPYGRIASFEATPPSFMRLYPQCNASESTCTVEKESLIGYCEKFDNKFVRCMRDGYSLANRVNLCKEEAATYIGLAAAIGYRAPENICSKTHKVCVVIPGEEGFDLASIMNSKRDAFANLTGYTMLITPFNYTVAVGLAAYRYKYPVKGDSQNNLTAVNLTDNGPFGMGGLTPEQLQSLTSPNKSVDDIINDIDAIVQIIDDTKSDDVYNLLYIEDIEATDTFVYPAHPIAQVHVTFDDVHIRSACSSLPLKVLMQSQTGATTVACTTFYVSGERFTLTNMHLQSLCPASITGMDAASVVFGGSSVAGANIDVNTEAITNPKTPVIFVGDDTAHFERTTSVDASDSTINISAGLQYGVAAARTTGDILVNSPNGTACVIQPRTHVPISVNGTNITIIDISKYTRVFGDAVMRLEFPEPAGKHAQFVCFGILLTLAVTLTLLIAIGVHTKEKQN